MPRLLRLHRRGPVQRLRARTLASLLYITLRRVLARQAGLTNKALVAQVRVSYAKVTEYQRRGVVHFHAIIRLDGPAGPTAAPPPWASLALLTAAIDLAGRTVHLETPTITSLPARTLAWGRELDTRPVTTSGELTDTKVAAYVAKYATKAAECTGTLDRRVTPSDQLAALPIREHARRLIAECLRLSKLPGLEDLRLAAWAHMLGFSGHYADCRIMRTGAEGPLVVGGGGLGRVCIIVRGFRGMRGAGLRAGSGRVGRAVVRCAGGLSLSGRGRRGGRPGWFRRVRGLAKVR